MATRGPRPLPSAIKRLQGTDQPCRMNPNEPPALPGVPEPPTFLDDIARKEWLRITPELEVRGLIEVIDLAILTTYCTAWSQLCRAERALTIEGAVVVDTYGRMVASPHAKLAATARSQLVQASREMGLSPSSRATVTTAPRATDTKRDAVRAKFFGNAAAGGGR